MSAFDQVAKNKLVKNFVANLGFGKSDEQKAAEKSLEDAKKQYEDLNPPSLTPEKPQFAQATDETPSAMQGVSTDPAFKAAQMEQLAALKNLAANGGRNASMDANLARIQQAENANARGQRGAVMQNAAARGMGGSGAELIAQLAANQNDQTNQNAEDLGIAANAANTAINAGMGASNIGSSLENNAFNEQSAKAQAQDAINRFNTTNRNAMSQYNAGIGNQAQQYNTGLQQQNYQNQLSKAGGVSGVNMGGVNYNQNQANMAAQQAGNMAGGLIKFGAQGSKAGGAGAAAGGGATGASSMAGDMASVGAMASRGGRVPGNPVVNRDSTLNDFVPVRTSPEEVIVPRSLAKTGSSKEISNFVKHPPQIKMNGNSDRESMLSALKNISSRKKGAINAI